MPYELREGHGSLFKNDKREEGSNQPNARGDCKIGGVVYEVSAWTKDGKKGKFQSLSFKPKEERSAPTRRERVPAESAADENDTPF